MATAFQKFLKRNNVELKFPEWKVYFEGSFWGHHGRDRAGKEIIIGKKFLWGGNHWLIPAVYACGKGLVMDCCLRVPAERIRAFMDKWNLSVENDDFRRFTRVQRMQLDAENPLCVDIRPEAMINGKKLQVSRGCGVTWNPCLPECFAQELEAQAAVRHYDLDPADGWAISRWSLCWATKRRPEIKTLSITLQQNRVAVPGSHFRVAAPGDSFQFSHPATGQSHTLIVQEYEQQEMPENRFNHSWDMEFPTHYTVMSYTLTPELPDGSLTIEDCTDCDQPRKRARGSLEPDARIDTIGIIVGADGPTAIISGQSKDQGKLRGACSSPHFEPVDEVEWRVVFHEKQFEDLTIDLI